MKSKRLTSCFIRKSALVLPLLIHFHVPARAQDMLPYSFSFTLEGVLLTVALVLFLCFLTAVWSLQRKLAALWKSFQQRKTQPQYIPPLNQLKLSLAQLARLIARLTTSKRIVVLIAFSLGFAATNSAYAQGSVVPTVSLWTQSGVIITILLIAIPILVGLLILVAKMRNITRIEKNKIEEEEAARLADYLAQLTEVELQTLKERKAALEFSLSDQELSGAQLPEDKRGILTVREMHGLPLVATKKKAQSRPHIDPALSKIILWYLGTAIFWLLFGTSVGEYLGIKFVAPDADQLSWLSFGRLRPVHTNAVFWGWATLGMLGLGYYVVPRVGNAPLANIKWAWYSLYLINAAVLIGSISLMAGINNGGGEYREYTWPVMLLFVLGLGFTLRNYLATVAQRKTEEIYISNWYIISAVIFISIIAIAGYLPYWQNGLGETIIQGYYMHQAVGMYFMFFTLGIVYYFLPQQLNKPIYSYSLGILAFWVQILFYTLIGTHHFVFSAIPWWLQTVAIVASAGMVIPVIAGTTNFLMTFKGAWYKIMDSYTIPFFLVGIVFYFTGSLQGTAEAFRYTNQLWHFTDFTVAHSHITMYGIITFLLWAGVYALVPRLTGKEAPQLTIGAHFWLALIGLMFYTISLMYGGTLRGLSWMAGAPFLESVKLMIPYWLWRAIGGTLMWLSHLFFAYNFYKMVSPTSLPVDLGELAISQLEKTSTNNASYSPSTPLPNELT